RKRQVDPPLSHCRPPDDNSPIGLSRRILAKRPRQGGRRSRSARNDENAARLFVQPMHEARAFEVSETQAIEQSIDMPLRRSAALNREPRRLVEDDNRLVTVQDRGLQHGLVRRPRLWSHGPGRRRQLMRRNADRLTRNYPIPGPRPLAVDADPPGAQQFFELPVSQTG